MFLNKNANQRVLFFFKNKKVFTVLQEGLRWKGHLGFLVLCYWTPKLEMLNYANKMKDAQGI